MPTPIRQFEIGNIYHVFNRGIEKRKIFQKQQDYERFVLGLYFFNDKKPSMNVWENLHFNKRETKAIISSTIVPPGGTIVEDERSCVVDFLSFALMPNHFHFILREIRQGGITLFMQKMGGYSQYFNKQYDRVGPLFQGRYKAVRIKDDEHLINIFSYVHTNPVELHEPEWKDFKVKDKRNATYRLENYRWSSYLDYIGQKNFPYVTQRIFFDELLNGPKGCQQVVEDWISFKAQNFKLNDFSL